MGNKRKSMGLMAMSALALASAADQQVTVIDDKSLPMPAVNGLYLGSPKTIMSKREWRRRKTRLKMASVSRRKNRRK